MTLCEMTSTKLWWFLIPLDLFLNPKKIFRLGASKPNFARPLKIVCKSGEEAKSVPRSNKSNTNKQLHFRPDLTKLQRKSNAAVIKEFKGRKPRDVNEISLSYNFQNAGGIRTRLQEFSSKVNFSEYEVIRVLTPFLS